LYDWSDNNVISIYIYIYYTDRTGMCTYIPNAYQ